MSFCLHGLYHTTAPMLIQSTVFLWYFTYSFVLLCGVQLTPCQMQTKQVNRHGSSCMTQSVQARREKVHWRYTQNAIFWLKSSCRELSNGIQHLCVAQYKHVIYRWKGLEFHFPMPMQLRLWVLAPWPLADDNYTFQTQVTLILKYNYVLTWSNSSNVRVLTN